LTGIEIADEISSYTSMLDSFVKCTMLVFVFCGQLSVVLIFWEAVQQGLDWDCGHFWSHQPPLPRFQLLL